MLKQLLNRILILLSLKQRSPNDPLFNLSFSFNLLRRILIPGLIAVGMICIPQKNIAQLGTILIWIMACICIGFTAGFLFGFPRSGKPKTENGKAETSMNGTARPNTNLEEISDWLTKIIVGLSLVNAHSISKTISVIAEQFALSLNSPALSSHRAVGYAIVVGFPAIGFLYGYFYTRLFLQRAFIESDNELENLLDKIVKPTASQTHTANTPVLPSVNEIKNAEHIAELVPSGKEEVIAMKIKGLASSYEQIRYEMPSGDDRTRLMTEIASSMRQFGQAATFMLPTLSKSYLAGERLAAICILQMVFDPAYINWLAERITEEKPFLAYHAASALYGRILNATASEKEQIYIAVENAKSKLTYPDAGRDGVINRIINFYKGA